MTAQKPIVVTDDLVAGIDGTKETHPAYAQISASRVSGQTTLYGSDFEHHHYMTITIQKSELNRTLSRDWPYASKQYIEVSLSEAQWATFVSSPNVGSGVQCTLTRLMGEHIPDILKTPDRQAQFAKELNKDLADILESIASAKKKIQEGKMGKKALMDDLDSAERNLKSNLAFVASQFGEHMEQTTEKAKIEIAAYIQNAITRAGIKALNEEAPIKLIKEAQ